ncbi:hypothetical protein DFH29DRAFT_881012 [Suillus ampliporus]|nr:hypothetical protein DFH29DRAFT_881012 [Suillus ampliporus]
MKELSVSSSGLGDGGEESAHEGGNDGDRGELGVVEKGYGEEGIIVGFVGGLYGLGVDPLFSVLLPPILTHSENQTFYITNSSSPTNKKAKQHLLGSTPLLTEGNSSADGDDAEPEYGSNCDEHESVEDKIGFWCESKCWVEGNVWMSSSPSYAGYRPGTSPIPGPSKRDLSASLSERGPSLAPLPIISCGSHLLMIPLTCARAPGATTIYLSFEVHGVGAREEMYTTDRRQDHPVKSYTQICARKERRYSLEEETVACSSSADGACYSAFPVWNSHGRWGGVGRRFSLVLGARASGRVIGRNEGRDSGSESEREGSTRSSSLSSRNDQNVQGDGNGESLVARALIDVEGGRRGRKKRSGNGYTWILAVLPARARLRRNVNNSLQSPVTDVAMAKLASICYSACTLTMISRCSIANIVSSSFNKLEMEEDSSSLEDEMKLSPAVVCL